MDSEFWQDADHRVQRAKDLLRRSRLPEALEELRAAAELDPFNPIHHYELGRCLRLLGRPEESADAFARAAETDPREPAYWSALGETLLSLERWREAIDAFNTVEQLDPRDESAYASRILAHAQLGDHERAEQMFYLAQHLRDDRPLPYYHIGGSLQARGMYAKAQWCWRQVIELATAEVRTVRLRDEAQRLATQAYLRLAESYAAEDRPEEARRHYLQALARDGRQIDALLGLGELLLRMRQFDAAGERIIRAVRLDPDDPRGHFLAGKRFFILGKLNEAFVALKRVVELDGAFPRAHLMLAKIAARNDDPIDVRQQCRAEMMRRPDCSQTLRELGGLLMDVGDLEHAVACFKRLVALEPGDSHAWQNLAVAECWRGQLMQGVVASRRALQLDAGNLDAANNLALAFLEMRELDAAARVVNDSLMIDPRHRLLRRVRVRLKLLRTVDRIRSTVRRLLGREEE